MNEIKCKCGADSTKIIITVSDDDKFIFKCTVCQHIVVADERIFYSLIASIFRGDDLIIDLTDDIEQLKKKSKREVLDMCEERFKTIDKQQSV